MGQTGSMAGRVDPVERVLNLLTLLHESTPRLTRAEIVQHMATGDTPYPDDQAAQHQLFSSDRRTITVGLGIAIHQAVRGGGDAGRTEYWIDSSDVHLPHLDLDDDERLVLSLALAAVGRTVPHAGEASMKLSSWIGATGATRSDGPFEFAVDLPDAVVDLTEAARAGVVVERTWAYDRSDDDRSDEWIAVGLFEPWAVVLWEGTWYAVGHDETLGVPVAVRVDRIDSPVRVVEGLGRSVEPLDLDEETLAALVRAQPDDPSEVEVATVLVDEVTAVRATLSGRVVQRSQVDLFGDITLKVEVDHEDRFRSWLLALVDRATLVAPADRVEGIVGWLRAVVATERSGSAMPNKPGMPGRRRGPEPVAARLHRLLSIVPWLYRQRSVSVAEVAERVGATPQQVMRDLTLASMCGTPPYGAGELYGFWVEPETGTVNVLHPTLLADDVRLTPRQAASVAVALASIEALPGEHQDTAVRLRQKLDATLGGMPVRVTLDDPPFLDEVASAAERSERLSIEYVDLGDRITERSIDPQKVFVDRATAYVIADDHLRGDERVFRIDRIVSVTATGEHFEPRSVAVPAGSQWSWMVPDQEVVVRLPPGSDWVLDRYATLAHAVEPGGWLVVWLSVVDESWLAVLLLRCGAGAEVLSPDDLAELPRRTAATVLDRYDALAGS